jgi:large subunit ribosomal protein L35
MHASPSKPGWCPADRQETTPPDRQSEVMPKMKTKSGAKKRFKLTGTGKVKRKHAFKNHILTKKHKKRKRALTKMAVVHSTNEKAILDLLK